MRELEAAHHAAFYLLLADEAASRYRLYLESSRTFDVNALASALDRALSQRNIEYRDKRASGRLHPPVITILRPGAGDAYKQHALARGQREGQFKFLVLQYRRECAFDFDDWERS
jgi:hypothetical protein